MTIIVLAAAALLLAAFALAVVGGLLRSLWRQLERKDRAIIQLAERQTELVDRAMVLAGKPWVNPPAQTDHLARAEKEAADRADQLEQMFANIVEEPQSGADYGNHRDIDELLEGHDRAVWDDRPPLEVDSETLETL